MFHVSVTPLVRMNEQLLAAIDSSTAIKSNHLDATKLAGLTSSNPVFHILDKPKHGRIKRIIRTSRTRTKRSLRDREIQHFTQEDLSNGVIYFVGSNTGLTSNTSDELVYRLEAPGVQPAKGVFRFAVISSGITSWAPLPNSTPTGHAPVPVATRKDIVVASCVVASLLLVIVTAIIIVRCRKEKYNGQNRHSNGHICQISGDKFRRRHQNNFDDVYEARTGIMSLSKDQPMCTPHLASDRFGRKTNLSKHNLSLTNGQQQQPLNPSDSDSWLESSRSRETSPSSSIPPSLPAFRVIPLCESELAASHLLDPPPFVPPPFNRNSNDMPPSSEAGSNPSESTLLGERSSLSGGGQPLLRRNQYWVWQRPPTDFSLISDPDSGIGCPESDSGSGSSNKQRQRSVGNSDHLPHCPPPPQPSCSRPQELSPLVTNQDLQNCLANIQQRRSFVTQCGAQLGGGAPVNVQQLVSTSNSNAVEKPVTACNSMLQAVSQAHSFITGRDRDAQGKPLKGILKNNQFQSLPRGAHNLADSGYAVGGDGGFLPAHTMLLPLHHQSCDTLDNRHEVLDTVESSV